MYFGIDYGMGQTNINKETGIRYGVIPMNSLSEWAYESFEADYGKPTCGHCGNELVEYNEEEHGEYPEIQGCSDYACEACKRVVDSDYAYGEEPVSQTVDDGEYKALIDSHNDVFVIESPYYTHAAFCSPCAPGACYLLSLAGKSGPKAYCLGPDWFENNTPPYNVYDVNDGSLVCEAGRKHSG